ncbi:roundabout homolog 2-like [Penaeus indicus]|uniref:roundabout homolog 2-like n=1 Tax=Penaeus indicus TaxID=29960 RepID=UPI00300D573F
MALLECVPPRGHPEPLVRWRRNGHVIKVQESHRHELVDEGSLMVKHVEQSDGGQYTCEAWNLAGSKTTVPVNLYVHIKPNFLRGPKDTVTLTDRKVEFECQVSGDPPPQVSWRRLRGPLPEDRTEILDDHTLRIGRVTPGDEDTYVCEAVNVVGTARANATLTVYTAPEFLVRPQDVKASVGSSAAFECLAVGRPSPLVVWSRQDDHNLLLPRQDTPSGEPDDQPNVWVNAEGTLIVNQVTRELAGWYSCAAVSAAGSLVARAFLDVPAPTLHPPPVISVRPRNLTVTPEAVALMVCQAEGDPTPRVTWTKDGHLLPEDDARITLLGSGTLQISDVREDDGGTYACTATSDAGKSSIAAHLKVVPANSPAAARTTPAPDPRDLPGPPLPPTQRARNSTTLTLAWGPPEQEGASPITSYILEIWNGSGQWTPLEEHIPAESYTLTGLKPNTQYRAVVRAMNMHGVSASSPVSGPLVTAGGGMPGGEGAKETNNDPEIRAVLAHPLVTLMPPTPISSTAIRLQWKVQEFEDYMDGFYVRYRDLNSGTHHFEMEAVTRSGAAHQASYTVSDLAKFTEYEFFIVPYHRNIHGHPSNSRIAVTLEDVPSAPPSGVESLVLNASSVVLSWRPPPREHTNGRITKYSLWLFVNKTVPHSNLTLEGNLHTLTLYNLTFGKHFTATVAAHTKAGQGPTSGGHTWLQDPSASSGSGEPKRVPSPLMAVLRETWFIGAVGAAGFLALSVFVAVVCYRRKRNEKRAMGGYKLDGRSVNGTMSGGLWIERGPWGGSSGGATDDKSDATPEKLLNLNAVPGDYAEVDGPVAPLMPPGSQAPGTPVAYATTNIIKARNGEKVEPNIPVYGSMYGDNSMVGQADDNLVTYSTLKKQQLYKPTLSPALNAKQPHGVVQRGYIPPWEQYAPPPLPENPPPEHPQQHLSPHAQFPNQHTQWRHQSPMVNRALNRQVFSTGSLPRHLNKVKASPIIPKRGVNTGDFDIAGDPLPPPPPPMEIPRTPPIRRDPNDPLPVTTSVGLQGLQGLSGSRMMGAPGAPRLNRDYSPGRLPDMYGGSSIYQGPIDEEDESDCPYNEGSAMYTDHSAVYESTSAFYGTMGDKAFDADRTNPLLIQQGNHVSPQQSPQTHTLHQMNGLRERGAQFGLPPVSEAHKQPVTQSHPVSR